MGKRGIISIAVACAAAVVVGLWAANARLPGFVRNLMIEKVERACASCSLQIDRVEIDLLDLGRVRVTGVQFRAGSFGSLQIDAKAESIDARVEIRPLWKRTLSIQSVEIAQPDVAIKDGDTPKDRRQPPFRANAKSGGNNKDEWTLAIEKLSLARGSFQYRRYRNEKEAVLKVREISGAAGPFSSSDLGSPTLIKGSIAGQIGTSGRAELRVATALSKSPLDVDVDLKVESQQLTDLNGFFQPNAGVILEGKVNKARGTVAENFRIDVARGSADQPTVGSDSRLAFVFQAV